MVAHHREEITAALHPQEETRHHQMTKIIKQQLQRHELICHQLEARRDLPAIKAGFRRNNLIYNNFLNVQLPIVSLK